MSLKEKINATEIIRFAHPLCNPNHLEFIRDSDKDFFSSIATSKNYEAGLESWEYDKIFLFARHYNTLPDVICGKNDEIASYLRDKYILPGPRIDINGNYLQYPGSEITNPMLDINGNKITDYNFRFDPSNWVFLNNKQCFVKRIKAYTQDEDSEIIHIFEEKARNLVLKESSYENILFTNKIDDEKHLQGMVEKFCKKHNLSQKLETLPINLAAETCLNTHVMLSK